MLKILLSSLSIWTILHPNLAGKIVNDYISENETRLAPDLSNSSKEIVNKYAKHVVFTGVFLDHFIYMYHGAIIGQDSILSCYAYDLEEAVKDADRKFGIVANRHKSYGFVAAGITKLDLPPNILKMFHYSVAINYRPKDTLEKNTTHLSVIKLEGNLKLDNAKAIVRLPNETYRKGDTCAVLGWGDDLRYTDMVGRKVDIAFECPYPEVFCIDLHEEEASISHCSEFYGGEPVICDGVLTGIVNPDFDCNEKLPRAVSSVYDNLDWIKLQMKVSTKARDYVKSASASEGVNVLKSIFFANFFMLIKFYIYNYYYISLFI